MYPSLSGDQSSTPNRELGIAGFGFLALLMAFASISTDLYLPAIPGMVTALDTTHGSLELTVSGYLLGFSVGQLMWGPLSDRMGRRLPLAFGLALFMVGSFGCGLSNSVGALIGWRVVQAVGASACVVIARAVVGDLFQREHAARVLSTLTSIMVIAPMLGPTVGALILRFSSWRTIFFTLVAIGIGTLLMVRNVLPESLTPAHRTIGPMSQVFLGYRTLISNRRLMAYALTGAMLNAGVFAYVAGSPFAYITHFNVSEGTYGLIFGGGTIGIVAMNLLNARLVPRVGADRLMVVGVALAILAGIVVLATAMFGGNVITLMAGLYLFVASSGFVMANAVSGGIGSVRAGVGGASAIIGCAQYGGGMVGSGLLGVLSNGTLYPLAVMLILGAAGSAVTTLWIYRNTRKSCGTHELGG